MDFEFTVDDFLDKFILILLIFNILNKRCSKNNFINNNSKRVYITPRTYSLDFLITFGFTLCTIFFNIVSSKSQLFWCCIWHCASRFILIFFIFFLMEIFFTITFTKIAQFYHSSRRK
jgi:hypothetical protein